MDGFGNDCLILIPFRLPQISCFTLSLKCFSSQTVAPMWDWTAASVPPPTKNRSSPTNTPVFPPSFFILLSFVWFYKFFSPGQVLLSHLSWCSAYTSESKGVFLMYPWREMYSTSTYSSAILFWKLFKFISLVIMNVALGICNTGTMREDLFYNIYVLILTLGEGNVNPLK